MLKTFEMQTLNYKRAASSAGIRLAIFFAAFLSAVAPAAGQQPGPISSPPALSRSPNSDSGIALAPARIELEMQPGAETTLVVNLDYHSAANNSQKTRLVASLNDWDLTDLGEVIFYKEKTLPNSASAWLAFSPAETVVTPNSIHAIRVTVSVPSDAAPGDHLTALVVEQRPDNLKPAGNARQIVVRYRMAAVFYIKVPNLVRRGSLSGLRAAAAPEGITVTATLKNEGNTVLRPAAGVKILDAAEKVVAEIAEIELSPVLAGRELRQPVLLEKRLPAGTYTIKYRVDFSDGGKPTEGITNLIITDATPKLPDSSNR